MEIETFGGKGLVSQWKWRECAGRNDNHLGIARNQLPLIENQTASSGDSGNKKMTQFFWRNLGSWLEP